MIDPLPPVLRSMASKLPPAPACRRPARKPPSGGKPRVLSDAEVLEARALHEFSGWAPARVAEWFGLDKIYTARLLAYTFRARLIPTRENLPRLAMSD